ncbi:MAG: tRNA lysidine(34) synthetase TilS, partial [Candidatus Neomarinimicrobiota bacterium]|nr:tRNA lysidine(34) synthetase TilS [Candidatus Neomarinimicrobiota bacterium]
PDREILIDNFIFSWKSSAKREQFNNSSSSEIIDANKIRNNTLTLRLWEKGDRFKPIGMRGSKKLSDFFIDEKIDVFTKNNQWLLLDGNRIIWVCGRRISDDIKITSKTRKFAKFIFKQ